MIFSMLEDLTSKIEVVVFQMSREKPEAWKTPCQPAVNRRHDGSLNSLR